MVSRQPVLFGYLPGIRRLSVHAVLGSAAAALATSAAVAAMAATAMAATAMAATVYKTVDADGVVAYSDTAPPDDVAVEVLVIDARAPELTETEQQRLEAMRETTDRMVADRQQREQHRAQLRKEREQQQPRYYPQPVYYPGYRDSYPVYVPYPVRPPRHGWGRPEPGHPIVHPPMRPPAGSPRQGQHTWSATSLPGNNYPASLVRRSYLPQVRAAVER